MHINYVVAIFSIFIIAVAVRLFRRNRLATRIFLMWVAIWLAIGFFALFPSFLDKLMQLVVMENRQFFLTTSAIVLLYVLMFYITSTVSRTDRKMSKLTREIAILNFKLKNERTRSAEVSEEEKE